jgi:hypothetical protein
LIPNNKEPSVFGDRYAVPRAYLKTTGFLPEETLPGGEVSSSEKGMLQNALNTSQCLDHVSPIIVQIPQLAIVTLQKISFKKIRKGITVTHT